MDRARRTLAATAIVHTHQCNLPNYVCNALICAPFFGLNPVPANYALHPWYYAKKVKYHNCFWSYYQLCVKRLQNLFEHHGLSVQMGAQRCHNSFQGASSSMKRLGRKNLLGFFFSPALNKQFYSIRAHSVWQKCHLFQACFKLLWENFTLISSFFFPSFFLLLQNAICESHQGRRCFPRQSWSYSVDGASSVSW